MDESATELLAALRNNNLSIEAKTSSLAKLKSEIKQKNVPDGIAPIIFEGFRIAITSQHSSLASAGFSALGHLIKRLSLQGHHFTIGNEGHHIYPLLLERLGDHKERIRAQAAQAFTDFWPAAHADVEHHVLEIALVGKNPRAKETSITWLVKMAQEHGLLFRTYVARLVACLEDADSIVRETAKLAVIELFQNAPPRAVSDFKKQLQLHNVRKSIATSILSSLGITSVDSDLSASMSHSKFDTLRPASSFSNYRREDTQRPSSVLSVRSHSNNDAPSSSRNDTANPSLSKSMKIEHPKRDAVLSHATSTESLRTENAENDNIEPLYVNSNRDVDDIIRDMASCFEGRESEGNWIHREKNVATLRRLTKGNAPLEYPTHYLAGIKQLLDGILKTVNSLRTTVSSTGCLLLQEIARVNGPAIDPMVEIILQNLIKVCGALKRITAQNGNHTVDAVISNVTVTSRILHHLWNACQDKNVQPRLFTTGWLKSIIRRYSKENFSMEHNGGLELVEKCIKKGLGDANPGVRENMRGTYWAFARVWPERADVIMSNLDTKSKSLLERDANNPNANLNSRSYGSPRSTYSQGTSTSSTRQTLKETIAAQKKARLAAARSLPPRPESAQSTFPEVKSTRHGTHRQPLSTTSTVRNMPTGSHASSQGGSLSSAPMRPAMRPRRPEIKRPATADPYSSRRTAPISHSKASSPSSSPQKPRSKTTATPPRTRHAPARPKSRMDNAPMSNVKRRPTGPDVAAPRPGEEPINIPSNLQASRETAPPASPRAYDHITTAAHADVPRPIESVTDTGPNISVAAEAHPEGKHDSVIDPNQEDTAMIGIQTPPPRYRKLSSNISMSKPPLSPSFRSHETSQEQTLVSPHHTTPSRRGAEQPSLQSPILVRSSLAVPPESPSSNTLKVYEDPQSPHLKDGVSSTHTTPESTKAPRHAAKTMPLEELPLNEPATTPNRRPNHDAQSADLSSVSPIVPCSENSNRRWKKVEISEGRRSLSPRSKDPTKARDMIDRGLGKIRATALDVHGYRKFQSLIRYHGSLLDESKYEQILLALFDALEAPAGDKSSTTGRSMDLNTQVLFTIRLMFSLNRGQFATYYARAMTSIVTARKHYESTNHIVSGLEETAEDIVSSCNPPEVIDAILDLLETEEKSAESYRMASMGTYVLSGLLRRLNGKHLFLSDPELERLGKFACQNLRNPQPDVRRAVMDYCLELHDMVKPEENFWAMINSPVEDFRPLLTYYIMRKHGKV